MTSTAASNVGLEICKVIDTPCFNNRQLEILDMHRFFSVVLLLSSTGINFGAVYFFPCTRNIFSLYLRKFSNVQGFKGIAITPIDRKQ